MTPDLERAAKAAWEAIFPGAPTPDDLREDARVVTAALRALENLSPEVEEAMAKAFWPEFMAPWEQTSEENRTLVRRNIQAAWRAGLNAILAAEGK